MVEIWILVPKEVNAFLSSSTTRPSVKRNVLEEAD